MSWQVKSSAARFALTLSAVFLMMGTALGAFGAHGLRSVLTADAMHAYETAVLYQLVHALGLFALGVWMRSTDRALLRVASWLIAGGILLFSGSIFATTFGAPRLFGALAPLGGIALMTAWLLVAIAAFNDPR